MRVVTGVKKRGGRDIVEWTDDTGAVQPGALANSGRQSYP